MLLHDLELMGLIAPRLVQDLDRNQRFPDIVQQHPGSQLQQRRPLIPEMSPDRQCQGRRVDGMEKGVFVEAFETCETGERVMVAQNAVSHAPDYFTDRLHVQRTAHPNIFHGMLNDRFCGCVSLFCCRQFFGKGNGRRFGLRDWSYRLRGFSLRRYRRRKRTGILAGVVSLDIELLDTAGLQLCDLL